MAYKLQVPRCRAVQVVAHLMNLLTDQTERAPGPDYFRRLAETLPGIIWIARKDGSIEYINAEGNAFTGRPQDETLGWGWWTLMHPDDLPRAQEEWTSAMNEGRPIQGKWRIKRQDNVFRWMLVSARPMRDDDGEIELWFGVSTDITAEVELQDELREAEHLASEALTMLESMQASMPVGFGYIDRDLKFVRVNWTLAEMDGVAVTEHPGLPVSGVLPTLWSQLEPVANEVLETGMPARNVEIVGELPGRPGDVRYWLFNCHPATKADEIAGVSMVFLDITDRHREAEFKATVLQDMIEGVYAIDIDGKINYVNNATLEMTGYSEADVIGKDAHDLFHFQHADRTPFLVDDCELHRARMTGEPTRGDDAPFTRKDGTIFIADYSLTPLKIGEKMFGAAVVFRELSEAQPEDTLGEPRVAA